MPINTLRVFALFLTLFAIALEPLRAEAGQIIASNLGEADAFSPIAGYQVSGTGAPSGIGYDLAVGFTVGGSSPVPFGSAELALAYQGGDNAVNIELLADSSGQPGAMLDSIPVANLATGPALVTATSTLEPTLFPGSRYWIAAIASGTTQLEWMANVIGQSGDLAQRSDIGFGPTPWQVEPISDPAVRVTAADLTPVSAPSTRVLWGTAALLAPGFALGRQRSKPRLFAC